MSSDEMTHDGLWRSLTTNPPGRELLDALEVVVELGTDSGRDLLQQAAEALTISRSILMLHNFAHHLGVTAWTPRYPVVTISSEKGDAPYPPETPVVTLTL